MRLRRVSKRLRAQLDSAKGQDWRRKRYKMQGGKCAYCKQHMVLEREGNKRLATLDHVIPLSRDGIHHWENTVAACRACNAAKGSQTADEFEASRESQP